MLSKNLATVTDLDGIAVHRMPAGIVWEGSELAIIRDSLYVSHEAGHKRLGVSVDGVRVLPSGFFGLLCDWNDKGVEVYLFDPLPNVQAMLWFRVMFRVAGKGWRLIIASSAPREAVA